MNPKKFEAAILYKDEEIKSLSEEEFKEMCKELNGIFEKKDGILICKGNLVQYEIRCDPVKGTCLHKLVSKYIEQL